MGVMGFGALAVALSGCAGTTEAEEAHMALRRWQVGGPRNYVYVVNGYRVTEDGKTIGTAGAYEDAGDWRLVVEDGKVTSARSMTQGVFVDEPVEDMTALLKHVIARMEDGAHGSDQYEATFDERWGYVKTFWWEKMCCLYGE